MSHPGDISLPHSPYSVKYFFNAPLHAKLQLLSLMVCRKGDISLPHSPYSVKYFFNAPLHAKLQLLSLMVCRKIG